jgi:hypothetical protein
MRARGFALRDAFPDVLKGLITAEEAQDYPDEAKPKQAKDITPRNPLDVIAPPPGIATSDPVVIEKIFAQDAEMEELERINQLAAEASEQVAEGVFIADVPINGTAVIVYPSVADTQQEPYSDPPEDSVMNESLDPDNQPAVMDVPDAPAVPVAPIGYALKVPGKDEAVSTHQTLDDWQDAYEDMADKIAKAGKRPARERMTILREFRECNEVVMNRVDMVKRIRHTAAYSKRLNALGAATK